VEGRARNPVGWRSRFGLARRPSARICGSDDWHRVRLREAEGGDGTRSNESVRNDEMRSVASGLHMIDRSGLTSTRPGRVLEVRSRANIHKSSRWKHASRAMAVFSKRCSRVRYTQRVTSGRVQVWMWVLPFGSSLFRPSSPAPSFTFTAAWTVLARSPARASLRCIVGLANPREDAGRGILAHSA